jgi:hypothetical protein
MQRSATGVQGTASIENATGSLLQQQRKAAIRRHAEQHAQTQPCNQSITYMRQLTAESFSNRFMIDAAGKSDFAEQQQRPRFRRKSRFQKI